MRDLSSFSLVDSGGLPLWLARLAGVGVLAASLLIGADVTRKAASDAVWLFLLAVTTPFGFGFLALVTTEAMRTRTAPTSAIFLGRLAGVAVLVAAVAVMVRFGGQVEGIGFWWVLRNFALQAGIACLVLVATEALRRERRLNIAVLLGRFAGILVILAAVATGIRFAAEGEDSAFWVFLLWATTPLAIGVLLLVATEAMGGSDRDGHAVTLGRAAGGLPIIAS